MPNKKARHSKAGYLFSCCCFHALYQGDRYSGDVPIAGDDALADAHRQTCVAYGIGLAISELHRDLRGIALGHDERHLAEREGKAICGYFLCCTSSSQLRIFSSHLSAISP
jgi:hypothetical protein